MEEEGLAIAIERMGLTVVEGDGSACSRILQRHIIVWYVFGEADGTETAVACRCTESDGAVAKRPFVDGIVHTVGLGIELWYIGII